MIIPVLSRPKSRGSILLSSSDPLAPPRIEAGYLTDQRDVTSLVAGVKLSLRLLQTQAFRVRGR